MRANAGANRSNDQTAADKHVGPFSIIGEDGGSLVLGQVRASGQVRAQRFTEARARARASKLGEGWEPWQPVPGSAKWLVRRLCRGAYDPAKADATYTVLGPTDAVMARFVTADAVPDLIRRARGDASVHDDRDGNLVIAGTDGAQATLDAVEVLLSEYEAQHVIAPGVVGYFTDSNNPGRALAIDQLDYDNARHNLDPRDMRAIEALAPGESHLPRQADPDEGRIWGVVTRLSAATQPKAIVHDCIVLGVGFDEAQARADAEGRSPGGADASGVEVVDASLAALSGWYDDDLLGNVVTAPDGTVRRIDRADVLPHDRGTPNDPGWHSDGWNRDNDDEVDPGNVCQADRGDGAGKCGQYVTGGHHIAAGGGIDHDADADHEPLPGGDTTRKGGR